MGPGRTGRGAGWGTAARGGTSGGHQPGGQRQAEEWTAGRQAAQAAQVGRTSCAPALPAPSQHSRPPTSISSSRPSPAGSTGSSRHCQWKGSSMGTSDSTMPLSRPALGQKTTIWCREGGREE